MMRLDIARWTIPGFLLIVVLAGCSGDDGPETYPVTGTVTRNGEPVEGAIVSFTSSGSALPASGTTDSSGVYQLSTNTSGDGAMAGTYQVTIAKYDTNLPESGAATESDLEDPYDITDEYPDGYDEMEESELAASISKNLLPEKYSRTNSSGLEATVTAEGENTFDFQVD